MNKVYGSSDDLIEIEGDIRVEFCDSRLNENAVLAFSDGTLLGVTYGLHGALWKFTVLAKGASDPKFTFIATDDDGDYSDVVEFEGPIKWVVLGVKGD